MIHIDPTKDLTGAGRLAGRIGVDFAALLELAEQLHIEPALRVDRIPFFDRIQSEQLSQHFARSKA